MDRQLTVLLLEDEIIERKAIVDYAETVDDIEITCATGSMKEALEHISTNFTDAIILDLDLRNGDGDGLAFLQSLQKLDIPIMPYILITTCNRSKYIHKKLLEDSDFFMSKVNSFYSPKAIIEHLRMMKHIIHNSFQLEVASEISIPKIPENTNSPFEGKISLEFNKLGISHTSTGRKYLIDAISICIDMPQQKNIPAVVAMNHEKKVKTVEFAMQNVIDKTWRTVDSRILLKNYTASICPQKGMPTIKEFIHFFADKVKSACTRQSNND